MPSPTIQVGPRTFWVACYFIVLFLLSLQSTKISLGMEIRIGQVALVAVFCVLLVTDLQGRKAKMGMLLTLFFFGLLFMAISSISLYPKNKENGFIIKYLFIYPAAFYLGQRALSLLEPKGVIRICESVLWVSCLLSIVVHYYPISSLIHVRPPHLSVALKGTFWEQTVLAFFFGLLLVTPLALRIKYRIWPSTTWSMWVLYLLVVTCIVASRSKSFWLAAWSSLLCVLLFNRDTFAHNIEGLRSIDKVAVKSWGLRVFGGVCVSVLAMTLYNSSLDPQEQIVNEAMLQHKWESERGAVLGASLDLIAQEPWLGLGFGAVEIATADTGIGTGEGTGMIFNSYLDMWISVGVLGFLYSLWILFTAYGRQSFPSQIIVVYLFIAANLNPIAQNEEYFIFLGFAWACAHETRNSTQLVRQPT